MAQRVGMAWCSLPSLMVCSHVPSTNQPGLGQRQDTSVCVQDQTILIQLSPTVPLACGEGARCSPLFPVLPCPQCSPKAGPKQLEWAQAARQGQGRAWSTELHFFPPPILKDMKQTSAPAHSHPCCWAELCSPRWFILEHILGSVWARNGSG